MTTYAKVIEDSVNPRGVRLTTVEAQAHRFILAELNTHRVFSRNSASSRAVPFKRKMKSIQENPAIPLRFPLEKPGMQGADEDVPYGDASEVWLRARDAAVSHAQELADLGVHKSVVNRLLEPFMYHKVVITSTYWSNFFEQRCSPLAQPEIREMADCIYDAMEQSVPVERGWGEWHLPYVTQELRESLPIDQQRAISAARCARTSYETHDGEIDVDKDLDLHDKLVKADPPHASPLEHQAMASDIWRGGSNFDPSWAQYRVMTFGDMKR